MEARESKCLATCDETKGFSQKVVTATGVKECSCKTGMTYNPTHDVCHEPKCDSG
jgi:hypothetical protein